MFIFLLQLRQAFRGHWNVLLYFSVFALLVWVLWIVKTVLSRRYRPWQEPHDVSTAVIVPVVDEPVALFAEVLHRIAQQHPNELLVVINGHRNIPLQEACDRIDVGWVWTERASKRNAIRLGTERTTGDVVVLVDSDTLWSTDTLAELVKPFRDPLVGGVTTKQRILNAHTWREEAQQHESLWQRAHRHRRTMVGRFIRRWADWMENSRARYSLPAQSALGQVGCLPGRTIAFRREVLDDAMDEFMTAEFLGVFLEVSDDRTLTNLTLKQGYRTVFQETSLVYTDAPTTIRQLSKQQLRWARGSQYNHLRMLPWMIGHAPVLSLFCVADILLPFLLFGSVFAWIWHARTQSGVDFMTPILAARPGPAGYATVVGFIIGGAALSTWLRQHRHLMDVPSDYLWMPAYVLFSSMFLMPLRLYGFFRMAHAANWGTRSNAYLGRADRQRNWRAALPYLLGTLVIGVECAVVIATS